jgi:hypothetical protein
MDCLVQILPKGPNLAQMLSIPYFFDFLWAPRSTPPGTVLLPKSNMAATGTVFRQDQHAKVIFYVSELNFTTIFSTFLLFFYKCSVFTTVLT